MPHPPTTEGANAVIVDQGMLYWRAPDGRIFAANMDERDYARKVRRGYQPLDQYGYYSAAPYYMDHPHEPLFQAGGARELRVEDLLALGYAQRPPLVPTCGQHVGSSKEHPNHWPGCWTGAHPVVFPQLEGIEVPPLQECEYCDRDDLTEAALKQHQEVMHAERRQQEGLTTSVIEALHSGGALGSGSSAETIAAAVAAAIKALGVQPPHQTVKERIRNSHANRPAFADLDDLDDLDAIHIPATGNTTNGRRKVDDA
jgi:hypothetical protein